MLQDIPKSNSASTDWKNHLNQIAWCHAKRSGRMGRWWQIPWVVSRHLTVVVGGRYGSSAGQFVLCFPGEYGGCGYV